MKPFVALMFLILFAICSHAQINDPVTWTYSAKKIADKTYDLHITATVGLNWHIYPQDAGNTAGGTTFTFITNPLIRFDGNVTETGKLEEFYDKNLKSVIKYYSNKVDFVQKVKVKSATATVVKGNINFVACNDKKCLPPKEVPFVIKIAAK
jgi:Disulphide bond corrector protein DsbC